MGNLGCITVSMPGQVNGAKSVKRGMKHVQVVVEKGYQGAHAIEQRVPKCAGMNVFLVTGGNNTGDVQGRLVFVVLLNLLNADELVAEAISK